MNPGHQETLVSEGSVSGFFFFPLSVFKGKSCWVQPSKLLIKILRFYVGNILGLVLVFFLFCFFNAGLLYECIE